MVAKTIQWLVSSVGLAALALAVVAAPTQSAGAAVAATDCATSNASAS